MLALADVTAALLASIALSAFGDGTSGQHAWSLVWIPAWVVLAKLFGLYDRDERSLRHLTVDEIPSLVLWALVGTSLLSLFLEITPAGRPQASAAVLAGAVVAFAALVLRGLMRLIWRRATPPEPIALIGPAASADVVRRKLELFPDLHMRIADRRDAIGPGDAGDEHWLQAIERIVYAPTEIDEDGLRDVLAASRARGLLLNVVPPFRGMSGFSVQVNHVADLPILAYRRGDLSRSTLALKRMLDVAVSGLGLVVLLPFFALIAVAIKLDSDGPILFAQVRAGLGGRPFTMRKFRSMIEDAEERLGEVVTLAELDEPLFKLRRDPRMTRVGRMLRRCSIDELPQLWNVLVGQMSLVGPRPEQIALMERYSDEQKRTRLAVKPGMTGPMQVYGRGLLTLAERMAVEGDYVENLSIGRDLRILAMTVPVVLGRRGAY